MKIVTWNCGGGFSKKCNYIVDLNPDVFIIQECANPNIYVLPNEIIYSYDYKWTGENKTKGLAIFYKKDLFVEKLNLKTYYTNEVGKSYYVKSFLGIQVNGYSIVGVWTKKNKSNSFAYIGQLYKFLKLNEIDSQYIVLGDFNANALWDQYDIWWNFTDVNNVLNKFGLKSIYHNCTKENFGFESRMTFYHRYKINAGYHIDYVYADPNNVDSFRLYENTLDSNIHKSDHNALEIVLK